MTPRHKRPPTMDEEALRVEGDRQLSDPLEAAEEDAAEALPETPVFGTDGADDLAELLAEEYVRSVTSGEEQGVELRDAAVPEEDGGPFVETSSRREFAFDVDESNPADAEVEPLPLANRQRSKLLR